MPILQQNISRFFILLICLIVTAKFALVFFLYAHQFPVSPIQDPLEFRNLALNILDGRFSSAQVEPYVPELYRTIGYPLFLSSTFLFDKSGYLAIFLQQVMIDVVALFLFLLVTKFFPQSKNLALFSAVLLLLDPRVLFWSLETMSETLFMFCAIASVFFLLWRREISLSCLGRAALFFGLAILTRPTGLLWLPGILLFIFLSDIQFERGHFWLSLAPKLKTKFIHTGVFLGIVFVIISPWIIRNYRLVGEPILSSASVFSYAYAFGGNEAEELTRGCAGTMIDAKGRQGCHIYGFTAPAFVSIKALVSEVKKNMPFSDLIERNLSGIAKVWIPSDYNDILSIGLKNFGLEANQFLPRLLYRSYQAFLVLVGFFGVLGIIFLWKEKRWNIAVMIVAILSANTLVNYGLAYGRHHIPLIPMLLFSASFGMYFFGTLYRMVIRKINTMREETASEKIA